jgi:dolichol-phosphate mannosyltransferase
METVDRICETLSRNQIDFEVLVVNDHSQDGTEEILKHRAENSKTVRYINNSDRRGYGRAVRFGLQHYSGDCVAIMMGDLSDDPDDLVTFYRVMVEKKVDCVFGSRFVSGGEVIDYPRIKWLLNRMANHIVKVVFGIPYNDCTNAFKLYRRETIDGIKPLLAPHYNLTLEMPLKSIVRGYSFEVIPNRWTNRKSGESKLKIKEMGSRYFFIFLYCLIEKYFSKGDYLKPDK